MARQFVDPGYGSALAPLGSVEWAKFWRLGIQGAAKHIAEDPANALSYYNLGKEHRAWALLTDGDGNRFADFDSFCVCPKPYGLETDPVKFRAFLQVELGPRGAELATVAPGDDKGGHHSLYPSAGDIMSPAYMGDEKRAKRLRAILRAPELIQELYRDGLVSQTAAALMGPASPDEEKAAAVVRARQDVEALPEPTDDASRRTYRRAVDGTIRRTMGKAPPSALDQAKRFCRRLSEGDRQALVAWLDAGMPGAEE